VESPDSGIRIRPTAEIEWRYRLWGALSVFEPGLRVLVQPNVADPSDVRVVSEVFMGIRFPIDRGIFEGIRVTPRCLVDFTTSEQEMIRAAPAASAPAGGTFRVAGRWISCSMNASIEFGG